MNKHDIELLSQSEGQRITLNPDTPQSVEGVLMSINPENNSVIIRTKNGDISLLPEDIVNARKANISGRTLLQSTTSLAGLLVTTEAMTAEASKGGPDQGGGMGGMGGMEH